MKKIFISLLTSLLLLPSFLSIASADTLDIKGEARAGQAKQTYADDSKSWFDGIFFGGSQTGEKGAQSLLFVIARDLKNVLILVAMIYLIVLVLRLFFGQGSDDDFKKWRLGVLWTTIGIVLMQIAFVAVETMFDKEIGAATAKSLIDNVIMPLIRLLEVVTSFIFIAMAIMAFYRIVAGGEEGYKKGISSIINSIIGFLLVKVSAKLVYSVYGNVDCTQTLLGTQQCKDAALANPNLNETVRIVAVALQYMTGFVGIITMILIIYAGFMIISSNGDEGKVKKGKSVIKFIIIGMLIIAASVILFNFMLGKDLSGIVGGFAR